MVQVFYFNPHAVPVFLAAFATLTIGIVLRVKRPDLALSTHFLVFCSGVFIWLFCTAMGYLASMPDMALHWFRWDNAGVMFISPSFFAFSARLTRSKKDNLIYLGYGLAGVFAMLSIFTHFPAIGVTRYWWGFFPRWSIPKSVPFFLFFFGFMLGAFQLLRGSLQTTTDPTERLQIRYALAAFVIAYGGSVDYVPVFGYSLYPFGYIPMVGFAFILFYAVSKHRLLNIELVLRDTTLHVLTACIVGFVAWLCIFPMVTYSAYVATFLSIVLTLGLMMFAYDPLRRILQPAIDRVIFSNRFAYLEELGQLPNDLLEFTNLREMLKFLVTRLVDAGKLEHAAVLMYDPGFQSYLATMFHSAKSPDGGDPETAGRWRIARGGALVELLKSNKRLLTQEDIRSSKQAGASNALADMKELEAAACFGISNEEQLVAFVSLGPKQNREPFNQRDLKILNALKLRLENFLLQAMVATQESLNMVKDSHDMKNDVNSLVARLNLRGHAVRTFEKKWLDRLQQFKDRMAGDPSVAAPIRESMDQFLNDVNAEISRLNQENKKTLSVEANTLQNLKNKLQNWSEYGRLVSEGFKGNRTMEAIDVSSASRLSAERWEPTAQRKGIQLLLDIDPKLQVWAERSLVEQIIENLIDNALKATDKGHVKVRCKAEKGHVVLEVEDTGCGIPKTELGAIFKKPFYQGKGRENLEKSTGIGLFLVAQYVKSLQGEVEVESREGHGSTFRVRLPALQEGQSITGNRSAAA